MNRSFGWGQTIKVQAVTRDGRLLEHTGRMLFPHKLSQLSCEKGKLCKVSASFNPQNREPADYSTATFISQVHWTSLKPQAQQLGGLETHYLFPGENHFAVIFYHHNNRKEFVHTVDLVANESYVIDFDEVLTDYLGGDAAPTQSEEDAASEVAELKVVSPPTEPASQPREPASKSDLVKRLGSLQIDINDDGMRVAIRRKSAFADASSSAFVAGTEQQVTKFGQTILDLHPGDYEIRIKDRWFGWENTDTVRNVTIEDTGCETIVVERKLSELKPIAQTKNLFDRTTVDFYWNGKKSFAAENILEAAVIDALVKRTATDNVSMPLDDIEDIYEPDWLRPAPNQESWFNNYWSQRPDCIVPGDKEGTWRIAPVPTGTLKIVLRGYSITGEIVPIAKSSRISPRSFRTNRQSDHDFKLPPGDYRITPSDLTARWMTFREHDGGSNDVTPIKPITITLKDGETNTVEIVEDYEHLASFSREQAGIRDDEVVVFQWNTNDELTNKTRDQKPSIFGLSVEQETVVKVLLRRLAKGEPEMEELELLKAAKLRDTSINKLFAEHEGLLVPGKTEGAWRLAPMPKRTQRGG